MCIEVRDSPSTLITSNDCSEAFDKGIVIIKSAGSGIIGNTCYDCETNCIYISKSSNSTITGNDCSKKNVIAYSNGLEISESSYSICF